MPRTLAAISLLVDDYDRAIRFYTQALRFDLLEDTLLAPGKGWDLIEPTEARS
jgi:catechol 2,3-dioxygenase-like lactoylglutathione lyase family enzyme